MSKDINQDALLMGLPLFVEGLGYLEQPKISEVAIYGYSNYSSLLSPLLISLDGVDNMISLLFKPDNKPLLEAVLIALKIAFNNKIGLGEDCITIGEEGRLDKDNFDKLQEVILAMLNIKIPPKNEREEKELSPEQQRVKEKLEKHRRRHAELNSPTFKEIINIVIHKGNYTYSEVNDFTYYQLLNSYLAISGISSYDEFILYKVSQKFDVKEDMEHWTKTLKKL